MRTATLAFDCKLRPLARILVRSGTEVGLFVPTKFNTLTPGLYQVFNNAWNATEVCWVGNPVMDFKQMGGLSPDDLLCDRENTLFTAEEKRKWNDIRQLGLR